MDYEIMVHNGDGTVGDCDRVRTFASTLSELVDSDAALGAAVRRMLHHWEVDRAGAFIAVRLVPPVD